jgi:hypothetical protein
MNCDDEGVAKCFGLEIARLLLDSTVRDFYLARYESISGWRRKCGGDGESAKSSGRSVAPENDSH